MEELDLETNNLCTTEDAFEQFQSGAMYEEDEFITLSDIVSSPHTNQDVNEILQDDPCDEVSSSIQNEKTVNNIDIPGQHEVLDVNSQTKEQNNKDQTGSSKKRGRKKKGIFGNSDVQQTQCQIDINKPSKPKRQTRKSLITSDTCSDLKDVEECLMEEPKHALLVTSKVNKPSNKAKRKSHNTFSQKEIKEPVNKNLKNSKHAKQKTTKLEKELLYDDKNTQISNSTIDNSNISTTTSTFVIKKNKHKRGRKKHNASYQDPVSSIILVTPSEMCEIKSVNSRREENNELENSIPIMKLYNETNKHAEIDDRPNITNKEALNNSLVSESVENKISEEDIEDLPLSNLSRKSENENIDLKTTVENKNFSDLNINSQNNTSNCTKIIIKKRGRPKKKSDNSPAKPDFQVKKITNENTEKSDNINNLSTQVKQNKSNNPEIISEQGISSNHEPQDAKACEKINISTESNPQSKRNSKKNLIPDFEYNVDSVVKNDKTDDKKPYDQKPYEDNENLTTVDSSRRPVRRRVLKNWNYDEGSDEDPYANIESSDDEPRRRKKGGRYYSDDEYFPGDKRQLTESESDIAMDEGDLDLDNRQQKKKKIKKSDFLVSNKSPRKRGRKSDVESISTTEKNNTNTDSADVDFEDCLDSSIIKGNDEQITPTKSKKDNQSWGKTNEFENFIAKIVQGTDIKISKKSADNVKTPLQIPIIEATEAKKSIEKSAQTITVNTKPAGIQTDTAYEIPMKDQVPLTGEQSEKACEFLSSIVQTTAELGQLMTQKSEDFIKKKINTKYVTDTFKMDYCVKKSFLLFKLAKHNLVQMEEDLAKQYEEFLKENNLIQHREEQNILHSTSKASDSDCEIVEEPVKNNVPSKAQKPAFNPKTVFLNKELSIKIAKKLTEAEPTPKKKLNIKGRHSVWINDSVLVKKVKPNQSFLAQDSRNKKPPDNMITLEKVNDFFKAYERQKALFICAPFIRTEWFGRERKYMCNYFVDSTTDYLEQAVVMQNEDVLSEVAFVEHDSSHAIDIAKTEKSIELCPATLSLLCTKIVQNCLYPKQVNTDNTSELMDINQNEQVKRHPKSLTDNTVEETHLLISDINKNIICLKPNYNASKNVQCLKTLCFKRVTELMRSARCSDIKPKQPSVNVNESVVAVYENDTKNIIQMKKNISNINQTKPLLSLLSLCVKAVQEIQKIHLNINDIKFMPESLKTISLLKLQTVFNRNSVIKITNLENKKYNLKTLLQLCIDATNITLHYNKAKSITEDKILILENKNPRNSSVMTLKSICYHKITELSTEWYSRQYYHATQSVKTNLNFTINNVNTISADVFLDVANDDDLGDLDNDNYVESLCKNEEEQHNYSDVDCGTNYGDLGEYDNNWVSHVQMQELRSCLDTTRNIDIEDQISEINEDTDQDSNIQIKLEPDEYQPESSIDSSKIKIEAGDDHEQIGESNNYSSINIITKQEDIVEVQVRKDTICRQNSISYDKQHFEDFVSSNKMNATLNDYGSTNDEIFSQSSQRVRRHYEPDTDDEIHDSTDTMNLLVPQNVESKDRLMESSQDEDEYKQSDKKKSDKRKGKLKKKIKDIPNKEKILKTNEVTIKIKDKFRQGQNKSESSDSDPECLKLSLKIGKEITTEKTSDNATYTKQKEEKVIQCNDVDSTELITENKSNMTLQNDKKDEDCDGDNSENLADERSLSPLIDSNEPIEVLECKPTLPIFDQLIKDLEKRNVKRKKYTFDASSYVDRHGWKCYPIDRRDGKIYADAQVQLDKLPESFVETYFTYQDVIDETTEDLEETTEDLLDKLTKRTSLERTISKELNNLSKSKPKIIKEESKVKIALETIESNGHLKKEDLGEFTPFEDKSMLKIDQFIPPTPVESSKNHFAKKILMIDDSDTAKVNVKLESREIKEEKTYKTRSGRTVKCKVEKTDLCKDDFMLTADKMMNKELALLHAPVELKEEDVNESANKWHSKTQKYAPKGQTTRYRIKTEDDSSSEEEKQWFTTKEKLLKRISKKNEDRKMDDAKRAKIVSEFIEKRGELPESRHRTRARPRCRKKTLLERRKQIKILSRELFGVDTVYTKKYSQASTSKGRRNIRKVIDKKSLACSTVIANMEEFERKRRLTIRQAQLREELGCEEGVNVVVINDELCLEYDFEEKRPVVSVHQFFTKVMKAHQYEGVKFMWDACFESVSLTGGGGAGGGCILAHCMGLGKTLQVLALLHTVLTHPQVGMRRVLVCCPLSTVLNWVDEIHKWIGPVTNHIKVFELSKLKKTYERAYQLEDWYNGGGIFIIGYELFRSLSTLDPVLDCIRPTVVNKIRTALLDPGPDIIVCDEGHLLKNDCSVLAVAMSRVVTKRRIILTGTPMQNNLREYYCMVNFVKPNLLGSYSEYSNRFENPIMNGQHRDSGEGDIKLMKARTHILHKVLEGCLQRQEASVLYPYLPKKYEYTVFISLTKCQWELYKHYLKHYINTKENKQSVLRDFHVLQKIWTHPLVLNNFLMKTRDDEKEPKMKAEKLDDDLEEAPEQAAPSAAAWWARTEHRHVLHQLHSSNKFLVVFRLLHECVALGDKVLIFSTSLYTMDALEFFLKRENKWTLGREYYRLDGSVPAEVRQKWCREFNAPQNTNTKLFLISTRAGSLGLNMTAANRVIILDTSWNPAHDIQSIFRVYRFGQKKDCYIYRLVAMGTMEQKIYERSVTKQAVACRVVDEQQIDRHYNLAELSELYRLDEDGSGVRAGLAAGVRDAALLRVAAGAPTAGAEAEDGGGGLHAVHEHDSLLRGSSESVLPEHERNEAWMQFQQEHATTHIRNFEINMPKKSVETTNDQLETDNIKPEKDNESNTIHTTSKTKKKSNKKSKNKNIEPEPDPAAETCTGQQELDPDVEENMIKKIMSILIKHNFHTTKCPDEISALVRNVRDVVAKGPKGSLNDVDPLTASIAKVLLESENITCPEEKTKETDKSDEDKISTDSDTDILDMDLKGRKRRRNRIESDDICLPDTKKSKQTAKTNTRKSNESVNNDNNFVTLDYVTENTEMNANKEVLAEEPVIVSLKKPEIERKKSSESDPIVKIDERYKQINTKHKPTNTDETVENESSNECIEVNDNCDNDNIIEETPVQPTENESICLSDDDEPIITEPAPPNKPKFSVVEKIKKDDKIPLHKSLLTNKNFIKLVAHTYLSGNPMLDEDAAVLAAQYSTLKALKEVQATGKNITSGPIHDIAIKVLGPDLMKSLFIANPNKYTAESMLLETDDLQNKTMNDMLRENSKQVEKLQKPVTEVIKKPEPETKYIYKRKIGNPRKAKANEVIQKITNCTIKSQETITPEASNAKVVPVGIFKGPVAPSSQQLSLEECILPDDDEVIISSPLPPPPPIAPARMPLARRNSKQLVVNTVSSKESSGTYVQELVPIASVSVIPKPAVQSKTDSIKPAKAPLPSPSYQMIEDIQNKNIRTVQNVSNSQVSAGVNIIPNTVQSGDITICLDSDEEDAPCVLSEKHYNKPNTSRTLIVSPLVKNNVPKSSEINDKTILVPVTSVHISPSPTVIDKTKARTAAVDQRKKRIKERNSPKVTGTKCHPGDIIRINESGKVDVLKRITGVEVTNQSHIIKLNNDNGNENNVKKLISPVVTYLSCKDKLARKVSDEPIVLKEDRRKEMPSTSKQQKCPDPLLVLKNVVHIPAFRYEKTAAPKSLEKTLKASSAKEITVNTKSSNTKLLEVQPVITLKNTEQIISNADKQTILNKKSISAIKVTDVPKTMSDASQEFVIDLTSCQIKKASVPARTEINVEAGTSKDKATKKVSSMVGYSKKSTIVAVRKTMSKGSQNSTPSKAVPSTSDSKRSSPWSENSQSKKIKTDSKKKLSLKDFNLDDFDDIIELE